jgi:hypothetical protein
MPDYASIILLCQALELRLINLPNNKPLDKLSLIVA